MIVWVEQERIYDPHHCMEGVLWHPIAFDDVYANPTFVHGNVCMEDGRVKLYRWRNIFINQHSYGGSLLLYPLTLSKRDWRKESPSASALKYRPFKRKLPMHPILSERPSTDVGWWSSPPQLFLHVEPRLDVVLHMYNNESIQSRP